MEYNQTNRILKISTDLGANKAVLTEIDGEDAISRPFLFRIRFSTEEDDAKVKNLLGTDVKLWFGRPGMGEDGQTAIDSRVFHGKIRRLTRGFHGLTSEKDWRAEVVPTLWFLSRTTDCRIYQNWTVIQIIEDIFKLHSVTDYQVKVTGSYQPLEYCVQYRETALDFVSRLMEQHGIFYWHEHSEGGHKLIIGDDNGSTPASPYDDLVINPRPEAGGITRLDEDFAVRSGTWAMRDFNFETPTSTLEVTVPTKTDANPAGKGELYDYPGLYMQTGGGRTVASVLMEHEESLYHLRRGAGVVAGMDAGMRVKITEPGTTAGSTVAIQDAEVLITEIHHRGEDFTHWTPDRWGRATPKPPFYENEFSCLPKKVPFRAARSTPKPFVRGPQTAVVTGPSGEEIHTDKYGRVKVKFHWDRVSPQNDTSSCWIRVSQGWAGANWGQIHIPRVGHEVVVDFLEGDPDRPIITGRVYNADNTVPYALPANKTQSGIKTRSSQGGGASDFNELRFEDKKGSEQIYVHAQKNLDTVVENDETRHVMKNRKTNIDVNETTEIGGNKKTEVKVNFDETILGKETRTVTGNVTETFLANEVRTITGNVTETVTGNITETTTGNITALTTGTKTEIVMGAVTLVSPAAITVVSAAAITLASPAQTQAAPSWITTGATNADAYGAAFSNAGVKVENQGAGMVTVGMKIDNFGLAIANGAIEIKNKSMKAYTYAFSLKTGFTLYS